MNSMDFEQAVSWLNSFQQFGMKPGLDRILTLLEEMDHPEKELEIIHVAGTNGKGSVCRYLSSILTDQGYTVGLFTSPHFETIRERFCINDTMISEKELSKLISTLMVIIERIKIPDFQPTYFELCTALVFLYFKKHDVDYAIIEVGLGGQYDATNIVMPILSIITNISFDHQHILGETIEEIAFEKAGIIKDRIPIITAAEGSALNVIEQQARSHLSPITIIDNEQSSILKRTTEYQLINIPGKLDEYILKTCEIGGYQKQNIALAIHAIEQLQMMGVCISIESIDRGVQFMIHQGRMKIIQKDPLVIIDGAHNPSGIHELKESVTALYPNKRIILIFGVLKDKNILEMIREIHSLDPLIIITKPTNDRSAEPEEIYTMMETHYPKVKVFITDTIGKAIEKGFKLAKKENLILITGSLYTIRDALSYFKKSF